MEISSAENLRNLDRINRWNETLLQGGAPTDARTRRYFRSGKASSSSPTRFTRPRSARRNGVDWYTPGHGRFGRHEEVLDNVVCYWCRASIPTAKLSSPTGTTRRSARPASQSGRSFTTLHGHDNNRDMYPSRSAKSRWPRACCGTSGSPPSGWTNISRVPASALFTMPATDPINPNVDPLIYRLNGV